MVIGNLNIIRIAVLKTETYPPLIVDRNCVLSYPISFQGMKAVTWGYLQIIQTGSKINIFQTANGPSKQIGLQPL